MTRAGVHCMTTTGPDLGVALSAAAMQVRLDLAGSAGTETPRQRGRATAQDQVVLAADLISRHMQTVLSSLGAKTRVFPEEGC